jgi:hypothetical protein
MFFVSDEGGQLATPGREIKMSGNTKNFRAAPVVEDTLARNGGGRNLSHRIAQIADRYRAILDDADIGLTEAEQNVIREVVNGWHTEPADQIACLTEEVADAIALEQLDAKWGVDRKTILSKLGRLSLAAKIRVVEDAEAWWAAQNATRT